MNMYKFYLFLFKMHRKKKINLNLCTEGSKPSALRRKNRFFSEIEYIFAK